MTILRNRLLAAATLCILSTLTTAWAIAQPAYEFNLPQQSLADALRAIGRQTTMNILFEPESVENLTAPAVRGLLSPEEAIKRVLAGTKLVVEQTAANSLLIAPAGARLTSKTAKASTLADITEVQPIAATNLQLAQATQNSENTNNQASSSESSSEDSGTKGIQEIIVTAERRAENSQDVPISMSVFSEEFINQYIDDVFDVANFTPNFQISRRTGFAQNQITMRGQGDVESLSPFGNNSILTYFDGIPLNGQFGSAMPQWDLERIEVQRGPQGTLYGRNAVAGAIQYFSAAPTDDFAGYGEFTAGEFALREFRGAISGPITEKLKGRLSTLVYDRDGDVTSTTTGAKLGAEDGWGVRGILDWQITEKFTARLKVQHSEGDQEYLTFNSAPSNLFLPATLTRLASQGTDPDLSRESNYEKNQSSLLDPFEKFEYQLTELDLNYDFGPVALTAIAGYGQGEDSLLFDVGTERPAAYFGQGLITPLSARQWSGELRLTSTTEHPFQWIGGAFYQHGESPSVGGDALYNVEGTSFVLVVPTKQGNFDAGALFLHTTYNWTDRFKTTQAVRYSREDRSEKFGFATFYDFPMAAGLSGQELLNELLRFGRLSPVERRAEATVIGVDRNTVDANGNLVRAPVSDSWDKVTWRLAADYRLKDEVLVYSSISTGFKGGGFPNTAFSAVGDYPSVGPETSLVYEVGTKSQWLDDRLRVNASAFYNDHTNFQTIQRVPNSANILVLRTENIPNVELYGGELEIQVVPFTNMFVSANLGVVETKIKEALPGNENIEGNETPHAEDLNFSALMRYDVPTTFGTISPQVSGRYRGKYWSTKDNNDITGKLGGFWTADFRLGYESPNNKLYGLIYVRNLFDEVQPVFNATTRPEASGSTLSFINERRSWGVTLGYRF